ncbi:hypothetical protein HYU15_03040 [Candidatus Woesearchaeota archaeon]|nr:hypothetical protein [Candidatus Woesearchaeota archaeon]
MKKPFVVAMSAAIIAAFLVLLSYAVLADSHEPWRPGQGGGGSAPIPVPKDRGIPIPPPSNNTGNQPLLGTPVSGVEPIPAEEGPRILQEGNYSGGAGIEMPAEEGPRILQEGNFSGESDIAIPAEVQPLDSSDSQPQADKKGDIQSNNSNTPHVAKPGVQNTQQPQQSFMVAIRSFFRKLFG